MDISISNVFLLRPEGTEFDINATATPYQSDEWGVNTIGDLWEKDAMSPLDPGLGFFGLNEAKLRIGREFDLKLERRFPTNRFGGNCVLTRIGHRL